MLHVVYLVFNEGYAATAGDALMRADLAREAIRLGRLLGELMPAEPEALGLLALMLLQDSRREARVDGNGDLVLLEEQDRSLWRRDQIEEGVALLDRAFTRGAVGPCQVQAAIAALHAEARTPQETDWPQIAALYRALERLQPSPVVRLNRAVAVGMAEGPERGLRLLDELQDVPLLAEYHLYHAARADLLRRAGRIGEARTAYEEALDRCGNEVEWRYLRRRLTEVSGRRPSE